jgi:hypothetical protein
VMSSFLASADELSGSWVLVGDVHCQEVGDFLIVADQTPARTREAFAKGSVYSKTASQTRGGLLDSSAPGFKAPPKAFIGIEFGVPAKATAVSTMDYTISTPSIPWMVSPRVSCVIESSHSLSSSSRPLTVSKAFPKAHMSGFS